MKRRCYKLGGETGEAEVRGKEEEEAYVEVEKS